jgi:hypothetical protein
VVGEAKACSELNELVQPQVPYFPNIELGVIVETFLGESEVDGRRGLGTLEDRKKGAAGMHVAAYIR